MNIPVSEEFTCSNDFSPASLPTDVISSSTAFFTSYRSSGICYYSFTKLKEWIVKHIKVYNVELIQWSWTSIVYGGKAYWILAEFFIRSHYPSLFGPVDKHLRVWNYDSYEMRLNIQAHDFHSPRLLQKVLKDFIYPGKQSVQTPLKCVCVRAHLLVDYLHAQTPVVLEHSVCRRFLFALERCTRLETA